MLKTLGHPIVFFFLFLCSSSCLARVSETPCGGLWVREVVDFYGALTSVVSGGSRNADELPKVTKPT